MEHINRPAAVMINDVERMTFTAGGCDCEIQYRPSEWFSFPFML